MSKKTLLESINTPSDLKKLNKNQLPQLCDELRQFIIDELSQNPGHLGSSLGVVELSVALHYVFNTPYDRAFGIQCLYQKSYLREEIRVLGR